jgi:membrane protease YdiL (CAAX protease family)
MGVVDGYAGTLSIVGLFGPVFGACILTYRDGGWAGIRRLLGRLLRIRFPAAWWGVIVGLPLGVQAAAHFLPLVTGEPLPPAGTTSFWVFLSTLLMVTVLGGGQEEIGWRGYALDLIQYLVTRVGNVLVHYRPMPEAKPREQGSAKPVIVVLGSLG